MRVILACSMWLIACALCLAHGDDIGFKAKLETIPIEKVDVKSAGIVTKIVKEKVVDDVIRATGQIEELPSSHFDINSPVQGKVVSVLVDLGDVVSQGQPLAAIQSTDIARLQSELDQSKAELELAKNRLDREEKLFEKGISAKKDLDAAKAFFLTTEAKANAARSNLKILTDSSNNSEGGLFTIRAPKSGTIIERNISVGQVVNENQRLFHGYDLTKVWANADIYEKDKTKINKDQKVTVFLDGAPSKAFTGNITYIGSVINNETRTLPVKALLDNKENLLNPGAFIQLNISTGEKKKSVVIPRTALVEIDKEGTEGKHKHIVYLRKKTLFAPREIEVETHDSDTVEVVSGLMLGEAIVIKGAYQLQFGEGEHHEHIERESTFPKWLAPIGVLVALILGFILGRRRLKVDK